MDNAMDSTHFLEYDLETVMRYFIEGFEPPKGEEITSPRPEWFVDTAKRKVIFRVHTAPSPANGEAK